MTQNAHDEARQMLALAGAENDGLAEAQQIWLRAHLQDCESCRDYAETVGTVIRNLHSLPLAADARLVRATQMRVRFHAARLRESRERLWLVGVACLGVGLSATLSVPILWRLFAWAGQWAGVSNWVWQAGFAFCWIAPALVVSVLLLARNVHFAGNGEKRQK